MMRPKAFLAPAGRKVKLVWARLTLSKLITAYFLVAVIHCFVQVVFQLNAFSLNTQAAHFIEDVMRQGNVSFTDGAFVILDKDGALRECWDPAKALNPTKWCKIIWSPILAAQKAANQTSSTGMYPDDDDADYYNSSVYPSSTSIATPTTSSSVAVASSSIINIAVPTPSPSSSSSVAPVIQILPPPVQTTTVFVTAPSTPTASSAIVAPSNVIQPVGNKPIGPVLPTLNHKRSLRHPSKRQIEITPLFNATGTLISMKIMGLRSNPFDSSAIHVMSVDANDVQNITGACVAVLEFPVGILRNTRLEDIVFIAFQFWVLGMSTVAVLNESAPHAIAALLTHVISTAWSVFQIFHTRGFRTKFQNLVTNGACKGVNLLPTYWSSRSKAEIPVLALNVLALVVISILTWRVLKAFGWQTFKRIGADLQINKIYKIVLMHSITLQLSIFFIVVSMALWIDQLYNSPIGRAATNGTVYRTLYIVMYIVLIPWLFLGWTAVRRENRIGMTIFIVLSGLFLVSDASMFASTSWRLTFLNWTFFALMCSMGFFLTVVVLIFGILCRLNFGRDLSRYLQAEEDTNDFNDVSPVYPSEKIGFPNYDEEKVPLPSPTYNPTSRFSISLSDAGTPATDLNDPFQDTLPYQPRRQDSTGSGYSDSSRTTERLGQATNLGRNLTTRTDASWRAGDDHGRDMNINTPRPTVPPIAIPGRVASPAPSLARTLSSSSSGSYQSQGSNGTARTATKKRWVIE